MLDDLRFPGVFDPKGLLHLDSKGAFDMAGLQMAGKRVVLVLREERAIRSNPQLRWEFKAALPPIAEECGYERNELEQLHYDLLGKHYGYRYNRKLHKYIPKIKSSKKLNTKQFSEHQEWICRFAATEWGLVILLPDEWRAQNMRARVAA
jgi:hypothetical protein